MKKIKNDDLVKDRKLEEQAELVGYLEKQNGIQQVEIRESKKTIVELETKLLSADLDIAKASNEIEEKENKIELLEDRIKYLEKAIKQYQQLPDLKNMIDNLSSLTTPSIDKLVEIMKDSNFDKFCNVEEKIEELKYDIRSLHNHIEERDRSVLYQTLDGRRY